MVLEQQQILFSFILGIVFFTLQEVGMFFIVMDQPFAITCSLIVVAGMGITYHYTLRIYNRFNWNASIDHWQSGECGPQDQDPAQRVDLLRTGSNNNKGKEKDKGQREKQQEAELSPVRQLGAGLSPLHSSSPNPNAEVFFGAYLTLKVDDRRDRWQRHFFVLSGTSLLFYKDRQTHREKPSQPLNLRPIELGDFSLLAGAREPPFLISLLPHSDQHLGKAAWKFRCDTRSEFDDWLQALSAALALLTSPADDPHGTTSRDELVQLSSQHLSQLSQLETIPEEGERLSQW